MEKPSVFKKVNSFIGSDIVELISSSASELGLKLKDVTVEFYDGIDGTCIEVISNKE